MLPKEPWDTTNYTTTTMQDNTNNCITAAVWTYMPYPDSG